MEGKDRPSQLGAKKWSDLGMTVGVMLQICKLIFGKVKDVAIGSISFVVKGIRRFPAECFHLALILRYVAKQS